MQQGERFDNTYPVFIDQGPAYMDDDFFGFTEPFSSGYRTPLFGKEFEQRIQVIGNNGDAVGWITQFLDYAVCRETGNRYNMIQSEKLSRVFPYKKPLAGTLIAQRKAAVDGKVRGQVMYRPKPPTALEELRVP